MNGINFLVGLRRFNRKGEGDLWRSFEGRQPKLIPYAVFCANESFFCVFRLSNIIL